MKILFVLLTGWLGVLGLDAAPVLPKEARAVVDGFLKERVRIEAQAEAQLAKLQEKATGDLLKLHDDLKKQGSLAEAQLVLSHLVLLSVRPENILNDTGNLTAHTNKIDTQLVIRVTGAKVGSVWGTDEYTADTALAAAAVHSGAVKLGERALVLVTMVPGRQAYRGSARNGIASSDYGPYSVGYQVMRIGPVPRR